MKINELIIKYPWHIIIVSITITIILLFQLKNASIDPNVESMIPDDLKYKINTEKIENIFGSSEMFMILFECDDALNPKTLNRVKQLSEIFNRSDNIRKVLSLFDVN